MKEFLAYKLFLSLCFDEDERHMTKTNKSLNIEMTFIYLWGGAGLYLDPDVQFWYVEERILIGWTVSVLSVIGVHTRDFNLSSAALFLGIFVKYIELPISNCHKPTSSGEIRN